MTSDGLDYGLHLDDSMAFLQILHATKLVCKIAHTEEPEEPEELS